MNREQAREKAAALVAQMTVEERASQLRYDSPAVDRLGIPAYNWWNEALHGVARAGTATSFPQAIGMAATFDDGLLQKVADTVATEGRAKYNAASRHGDRDIYKGLTFWSPNINIFRDPRWGRGHETYGEDPYLTAQMGKAYVRGLQGSGETMKTAACAKHFAVHSGPEAIRHHFDAKATAKDMEETYLPAFEALVTEANVEAVMGAYNRTNGEACCGSKFLLQDTLRGKWDFQGHVVSDCWAIRDFFEGHGLVDTPEEAAALALERGCDLNCGNTYIHLMSAYRQRLVTEEQITEAVTRLFTTRYLLGIMPGQHSEFDAIGYEVVSCEDHKSLADEVSRRACVLLKNDGVLPLNTGTVGTVGVIGPNANSRRALIGNYYGTPDEYVTVLEGIRAAMEGKGRVLYSLGCALKRDRDENLAQAEDRLQEAVTVAQHSDTVVLVLGLDESLEGEEPDEGNAEGSGDKLDLLLPAPQRKLLDTVLALGKKTVVILMAGSAIDLTAAQENADAVLQAWYPGARGGKAVAEILFGQVSPSGKLPVTFYHNEALDTMPAFTDYAMTERTYRYYTGTPLYPFGYGLTYGDTSVVRLTADKATAKVTVRNGGRDTEDVVQVYCKDEDSPFAPTNPVLCGFARVSLAQGEEKTVEISLHDKAFTVVNDLGDRIPGSGSWTLYASFGQPDQRTEELTGRKAVKCQVT